MTQSPGDGHFTRRAAMARANLTQSLDELEIFGEARLAKFRIAAAKIVCRQSGSALARHRSREQTRGHGSVVDHADSLLLAIRQNLGFNLPADDGGGWLPTSDRGKFFGAVDRRCTEIRNAEPTDLAFSMRRGG